MDLTIIAGPLIGAVIGYFTNYLAVKMLFRPRREIKIGSKTLPFTPGVIPKGKPRLARVIGRTVADTLVTGEDIRKSLLSDSMQEAVADKARWQSALDFASRLWQIRQNPSCKADCRQQSAV